MNSKMLSAMLFIVAVFLIVTVVSVTIKTFQYRYRTETALLSKGKDSELVQGVFIRDETVITYAGEGVISYEVTDGGKLGIGSVIADVYASDSEIETVQHIRSLENELALLNRISNPGTTRTAQPSNIAALFSQNYKEFLYQREQDDLQQLQEAREEMAVLLGTYQLITGGDTGCQERMYAIQEEIAALQQTQAQPLCQIKADRTAYFVSYADGYEELLKPEDIAMLTADQIQNVQQQNQQDMQGVSEPDATSVIGKLIESYQWVLAVVVDNTERKYKSGDRLSLKFASTSDTVTGTITFVNSKAGDDRTVLAITCEAMTYDLVQHRTESVELIQNEYEGIRVPRSALHFRSITEEVLDEATGKTVQVTTEYRGVYVQDGEQPAFRKLDVLYEGEDYIISKQRTDSDYLALYDAIITEGIDADGT